MHNDFVIVGPPDDPAGVRALTSVADVMRRDRGARRLRVPRRRVRHPHAGTGALGGGADRSEIARTPRRDRPGHGRDAERRRPEARLHPHRSRHYLALRKRLSLVIVFQGDPTLRNVYHVYAVNPAKHPKAKRAEARAFIEFLVSPPVQQAIAAFKRDVMASRCSFPMRSADRVTTRG